MILKQAIKILITASIAVGLNSCGALEEDEEEEAASTTTDGTASTELANPLSEGYPSALAISVFPTESSTSLALQEATTEKEKPPKEKVEDRQSVLKGGSDAECFPTTLFDDRKGESVSCYEFDNDMNPFNNGPAGSGGTANGKHTDGEACLVAFARQEVLDATQLVDRSLDTVAGILCAVKKAGGDTTLPEVGAGAKDFLASLQDARFPFTTASMTALEGGGYKTEVVGSPGGKPFSMTLVYKKGTNEGEGSGVISYKKRAPTAASLLDDNNTDNMANYASVTFSQELNDAGNLRNRFEVRIAAIEKSLDGLSSQGIINYDVIPEAAENSSSNNFKFLQFDMDSQTGEGDISYWRNPGGRNNEAARGFVFNIATNDSGVLAGCGASGAASTSIRAALSTGGSGSSALSPVRFWHPFANQNTDPNKDDRYAAGQGPSITGQCFSQNASSGLYEIDYDATKALSDTTNETEIDTHGYDVIPQAEGNGKIKPPAPPSEVPTGDFKPAD